MCCKSTYQSPVHPRRQQCESCSNRRPHQIQSFPLEVDDGHRRRQCTQPAGSLHCRSTCAPWAPSSAPLLQSIPPTVRSTAFTVQGCRCSSVHYRGLNLCSPPLLLHAPETRKFADNSRIRCVSARASFVESNAARLSTAITWRPPFAALWNCRLDSTVEVKWFEPKFDVGPWNGGVVLTFCRCRSLVSS